MHTNVGWREFYSAFLGGNVLDLSEGSFETVLCMESSGFIGYPFVCFCCFS